MKLYKGPVASIFINRLDVTKESQAYCDDSVTLSSSLTVTPLEKSS